MKIQYRSDHNDTIILEGASEDLNSFKEVETALKTKADINTPNIINAVHTFPNGLIFQNDILKDYEKGVFTPTIIGSTTAGVGTYNLRTGSYIKIGDIVNFTFEVGITNHTGTGNIVFGGLPYICDIYNFNATIFYTNNLTFTYPISAKIQASTSTIVLLQNRTSATNIGVTLDKSFNIGISGFYRTI